MNMATKHRLQPILTSVLAIGAGGLVLSAAMGLAFALWMENGPEIFISLIDAGLSCF